MQVCAHLAIHGVRVQLVVLAVLKFASGTEKCNICDQATFGKEVVYLGGLDSYNLWACVLWWSCALGW